MVLLIWFHYLAEHLDNLDPDSTSEITKVERVVLEADALRPKDVRFVDVQPLAGADPPVAVVPWDQVNKECMGKIATATAVLDEAIDREIPLLAPPAERSGEKTCLVDALRAEVEATHMSEMRQALFGRTVLPGYKGTR